MNTYQIQSETSNQKCTVQIPDGITGVSLIGANKFRNGDVFQTDGYVYNRGKKTRKWFATRPGWNHFWEQGADLHRVENLYAKLCMRYRRHVDRHVALTRDIFGKGATAHAQTENGWIELKVEQDAMMGLLIHSSNTTKPKKPILLALGNRLQRMQQFPSWKHKMRELFVMKATSELQKQDLRMGVTTIVNLKINGREYFFECYREDAFRMRVKFLAGGIDVITVAV